MGAPGDVFQVIDRSTSRAGQVLNIYFYKQADVYIGNAAEGLADAFIDQVLPSLTDLQTNSVLHTSIEVKNLFDESEAHTSLISETGLGAYGSDEPYFIAAGFRMIGDNAAVRNGQKRIGGLGERSNDKGVFDDPPFLAHMVTYAGILVSALMVGLDVDLFIPVIVKRILEGTSYRLPANATEAVISNITDALFNVNVTTQNSRKPGRGE